MTGTAGPTVRAHSPGRVNLMGDHTDYNEGVALPMAIDLGTDVTFIPDGGTRVVLRSAGEPELADVDLYVPLDPDLLRAMRPPWSRFVAGMVAAVRPATGGTGSVESSLPIGAGLSSSAALEVALALAFGFEGEPVTMARTCQGVEEAATGVPSGLMDQLVVSGGVEGSALLIDFSDLSTRAVRIPDGVEIVVVHSGLHRSLGRTAYAARRAECDAATHHFGPLGRAGPEAIMGLPDPVMRRRARHVITECDRVRWFAEALEGGDLTEAGRLMVASHRSLAGDFEVSTPELDQLVVHLTSIPGVHGARMTGAGFGGCVVALSEPGVIDLAALTTPAWRVRASAGARVVDRG